MRVTPVPPAYKANPFSQRLRAPRKMPVPLGGRVEAAYVR